MYNEIVIVKVYNEIVIVKVYNVIVIVKVYIVIVIVKVYCTAMATTRRHGHLEGTALDSTHSLLEHSTNFKSPCLHLSSAITSRRDINLIFSSFSSFENSFIKLSSTFFFLFSLSDFTVVVVCFFLFFSASIFLTFLFCSCVEDVGFFFNPSLLFSAFSLFPLVELVLSDFVVFES